MDSVVLVGIFAGCFVFISTMVVVGALLYFGGSFDRIAREQAGLTTDMYETKAVLHDHVLERARQARPGTELRLCFPSTGNDDDDDHRSKSYDLRPVTASDDFTALFDASHGFHAAENLIWRFLDTGPFDTPAAMHAAYVSSSSSRIPRPSSTTHYVLEEKGRRCGPPDDDVEPLCRRFVGVLVIDDHARRHHLRLRVRDFWLIPACQHTGLAQLVMYHVACHVFESQLVRRLEWRCDGQNLRGRKFAHRFGFQFESLMRKHRIVKDANVDTAVFVMVYSDWPVVKAQVQDLVAKTT